MSSPATRAAAIAQHVAPEESPCAGVASATVAASTATPVRILVTGAAGQIAYSLLFMLARGNLFGPSCPVVLHLLDIPPMATVMRGVVMELEDGAFPCLRGILATTDLREAFANVNVAFLVGAFPRKEGMERKELLSKNAAIFKEHGAALNAYASRNVKVLVVGNPANTNALVAQRCAPDLPPENFTAMTRLDHNRARAKLAAKIGVPVERVRNVIIWGNHSNTQFPDMSVACITDSPRPGVDAPALQHIGDISWIDKEFIPSVQQRGAAVIKARKLSSAASAATAAVDHMRDWLLGTPPGEIVSMAVRSDGSYGIPRGVIFSFPVTCTRGTYRIVQGVDISASARTRLELTHRELLEEKRAAFECVAGTPGEGKRRESWEMPLYITIVAATAMLISFYYLKEENSLTLWAQEEVQARRAQRLRELESHKQRGNQ